MSDSNGGKEIDWKVMFPTAARKKLVFFGVNVKMCFYSTTINKDFPSTNTGQIWDKPLTGNFTIALNTWLKDGHIGSQQWSRWCHLGSRQGSITRQVKWMWSEVLCHSRWTPPEDEETQFKCRRPPIWHRDTHRTKCHSRQKDRKSSFYRNSWKLDFLETLLLGGRVGAVKV